MGHRLFGVNAGAGQRVEACPPGHPREAGGVHRFVQELWCACVDRLRPGPVPAEAALRKRLRERELARLHAAKDDFDDALDDLPADAVRDLQMQVDAARSLHELWHLRAGVFGAVARHLDQDAAAQRLLRMNRHFPTRSARSGFIGLDDAS
jgi:hypothetical protein